MGAYWRIEPNCNIGSGANTASKNKSIVRGLRYHNKVYKALRRYFDQHPDLGYAPIIEPWLKLEVGGAKAKMCQPDAILLDAFGGGIVVEAKLNWKDGRDEKLINLYLKAVKQAYGLEEVWPLLITSNVRGYQGPILLGMRNFDKCLEWEPNALTPVMLMP